MGEVSLVAYRQELMRYESWMAAQGFADGPWPTTWQSDSARRRWLEWDARLKRMEVSLGLGEPSIASQTPDRIH